MTNITLSIDKSVLDKARKTARAMGKSVNQLVREYLLRLSDSDDVNAELDELRKLSGTGNRKGWRFNRDEINDRTQLR